jgi:hypothetical protein
VIEKHYCEFAKDTDIACNRRAVGKIQMKTIPDIWVCQHHWDWIMKIRHDVELLRKGIHPEQPDD